MKITKEIRERFKNAQIEYEKMAHPNFPQDYIPIFKPSNKGANAITNAIIRFLKWNGHQAERVNTMGVWIPETSSGGKSGGVLGNLGKPSKKKGGYYRKTGGTKGSADIHSTINVSVRGVPVGISAKWEVKYGRDRQSDDQKKYERSVKTSGGYYFIVRSVNEFLQLYDRMINYYKNLK